MKTILFLMIVCLLSLNGFTQTKRTYAQISGNFEVSKPLSNGVGGTFSVHHFINRNVSIGAGFDFIKYKDLEKALPSAYADLRYHSGSGVKKPLLYFSLTPGYSFYHSSYTMLFGNVYNHYEYKSGFLIGAGFGCIFHSGKMIAPFVSVMYNRFPLTFTTDLSNQTDRHDVIKINFGIKF